jgi:hypothetical protein
MQPWIIQRIIREILPFVIDGVRSQMRARSAEPAPAAVRVEPADEPGLRSLRRQMEARLREISDENEARFAALQSQVRALEDRLLAAHQQQQRQLERTAFYARLLLGWAAALNIALVYLLLQ